MTRTLVLPVDATDIFSLESQASLARAADILRAGGTVAFPTETVYGLGANAWDASAVGRIFAAKQRPEWDPLIVHIAGSSGTDLLNKLVSFVSPADRLLMDAFWPGPLTVLLTRRESVPDIVTAGRAKVGVRMPANPVARALLEQTALPLAAPSANSFGRTSPTTAQHVLEDLDGRIDAVIDGGPTRLGLESTVIDANAEPPVIYRHGMISFEEIRKYLPNVTVFESDTSGLGPGSPMGSLPSPGVGLRHYAPRARLILVAVDQWEEILRSAVEGAGVLLPDEFPRPGNAQLRIFQWGKWTDPDHLAQRLFAGLREMDALGVELIYCPIPTQSGVGAALRDRLQKAAKSADS